MWPFKTGKYKPKTKMFNVGHTTATITHSDGTIYKLSREGWISSLFELDDTLTQSEQLLNRILTNKDTMIKCDCGTLIPKCNINKVTLETVPHLMEAIDYD